MPFQERVRGVGGMIMLTQSLTEHLIEVHKEEGNRGYHLLIQDAPLYQGGDLT